MTKETRMFKHSNGVRHKYTLQSRSFSKGAAANAKQAWKSMHYYVRIVPARHLGETIYKIFTFRLDK